MVIGANEMEVRKATSIVSRYAEKLELKLNKEKSGILVLFRKKTPNYPSSTLMGIPYVKQYQHLGTNISYVWSIKSHINEANLKMAYQ